jgi:alpha-L-fucosidase
MNAMVREIQPHIIFNGRNGLPGDFATPEGHMSAPNPWRPWEACMTHNNNWGFHAGDHNWKTPEQVVDLLATAAQGVGNLLLNIGPKGDGSLPKETVHCMETVGAWLKRCGEEAIFDTERFTYGLREKGDHRGDWSHHGPFTAKKNNLYWLVRCWPGSTFAFGGLEVNVASVHLLGDAPRSVSFKQENGRVILSGLPETSPDSVCPVLKIECDRPPAIYQTCALRIPKVPHPHYDPCPSDIQH